jgi:hypothetical protein
VDCFYDEHAIALLLLVGHTHHRNVPDNPMLEEGIKFKCGSNKRTSIGQPMVFVTTLLDKEQAYPSFSIDR